MPREAAQQTIDDVVRAAMEGVVKRASKAIAKAVATMAAERLDKELQDGIARARGGARGRAARPAPSRGARPRVEITRWVADRRARRVPKFVIESTNLKTKKAIVAKYGEGVAFEKGKPLPKPK
ncbi:hypothetical protein [Anaeromyxobacter paludicola]|uniref:HK97 gp10 family phage protein n=1 Tax=Anaeromyxobacter paludicola TaxID=2918171 RepID=A0ABM7X7H8_9BACT|nr:hypothetical protein [Anaeromyxobacter paludicola]BDG07792.1 hypothetical protein AMPC_09050 [Anaeromyxobacter paludicola]